MFDSHTHLDDESFAKDREPMLERARAAGVRGCLLAGVEPAGWPAQAALALAHRDLFVAYGVHPWVVARAGDEEMERMVRALEEMLAGARVRPVALGEMGLDRSPRLPADGLGRQERALRAQLAMARALDLPVVLHVLRAHEAALAVLRSDGLPARGGVVHSFSGSAELARAYLKLGLHLSFAGPITYENARKTREAARAVPAERLLVETDAPDQTPRARKPGRNEPAFLAEIVEALAHARGEDPAALARSTADNARRLFGLAPG